MVCTRPFVLLALVAPLAFGCTASGAGGAELTGQGCVTSGNCAGSPCVPVGGSARVCTLDCTTDAECMPGWSCETFGGVGDVCRCDREPELCDGDDDDCDGVVDEACGAPDCGDGACNGAEDCASCAEDCGACAEGCGDLVCGDSESCETCAPDCGECVVECGDGICDEDEETCESCPGDCGACMPVCGDGVCEEGAETCDGCAEDCGPCCADDGEPADSEDTAARQGRPAPWGCVYEDTFGGVLAGAEDQDWFSLPGSDTRAGGCTHTVRIDSPGVSTCLFASCATVGSDPDAFTCVDGAPATSPLGKPGCCTTAGPAALSVVCTEGHGTATSFYVRVEGAAAGECLAYEVTYSGTSP